LALWCGRWACHCMSCIDINLLLIWMPSAFKHDRCPVFKCDCLLTSASNPCLSLTLYAALHQQRTLSEHGSPTNHGGCCHTQPAAQVPIQLSRMVQGRAGWV
jgi:hypothetical protein